MSWSPILKVSVKALLLRAPDVPGYPSALRRTSELIEPYRIVDQDLLACCGIGYPDSQLVQEAPIVDLEQRSSLRRLVARRRVGMRPVRTPHDPIRIGSNQCLGEWRDVLIVGRLFRRTIGTGNFDVNLAGANQLNKVCESRLFKPECRLSAAKMVEDHRNGRCQHQVLYAG